MTRVGLYGRVSSDVQEKEHTIWSQMDDLRRHAQQHGYEVVEEYLDEGYSGATLQRPGLDRLRDAISAGQLDVVLFHSPDSLDRKAVYQYLILEEMEKAGVPRLSGGRFSGEQDAPGYARLICRIRTCQNSRADPER